MFIKTNKSAMKMVDCAAYGEVTQHRQDVSNLNDDHTYECIPFHREAHSEPRDQSVISEYEEPIST